MSSSQEATSLCRESGSGKNGPGRHIIRLLKILLVLVNTVVLVLEVALVGSALYLTTSDRDLLISGLGQHVYQASFGAIIAGGIFIILFTIFGIVGTIQENRCFLAIYFTLMFLIVMGEVSGIALTTSKIETLRNVVTHNVYSSLRYYANSTTITHAWDLFQNKYECCGMANPADADALPWKAFNQSKALNGSVVPASCCVNSENRKECMAGDAKYIYAKDCFKILREILESHQKIILGVGLSSLTTTVAALFLTGVLILFI